MSGLEKQNVTSNEWDDEILTNMAVDLVVALMKSADPEIIRPMDWWSRAKTALVVSASVAETYPAMISKYLSKIQVVATKAETSEIIATTRDCIASLGMEAWERFRFLCERDALYIVAMSQVQNQQRRLAR